MAESIASGRGFSSPLRLVTTGPTAWFGPIYPYLAAGIFRVGGIYTPAAHVILQTLNCLFAALVIFPIYAAAKRTFGVEVAVLASWLWVVLPNACHIPIVYVWDTTLSALWFALIFQATLALRGSNRLTSWMGYGALWGIGGLTNPSLLSTMPFLLAWLVWGVKKQLLPWLRPVAAALFVFALCLAPWTVRNYRLFGKVIPVRSNFGLELWLGNNPRGSKVKEFALHPFWNAAEAERYKRLGEIAYMEEKQHAALAFMKTHPAQTLGFIFRRFAENWFVPRDRPVSAWSGASLAIKAFLVLNGFIVLFSGLGAVLAYRSQNRQAAPYLVVMLIFPVTFCLTHPSPRYRLPMDPMILILASYSLTATLAWALRHFPATKLATSKEAAAGYFQKVRLARRAKART